MQFKTHILVFICIVMAGVATGCGKNQTAPAASVTVVAIKQVKEISDAIAKEINATGAMNGKSLIADARSPEEFRKGHIPCALSFSVLEIVNGNPNRLISRLPKDVVVTIYAQDSQSPELSILKEHLEKQGLKTMTYRNGYQEWFKASLQIENED